MGGGQRLLSSEDRFARRPGNAARLQDRVKAFPVLGGIDAVGRGAQDGHAHVGERLGQLDGGLAAELHHCAPGLFQFHHGLHVLGGQRLEIELVRHVEVG